MPRKPARGARRYAARKKLGNLCGDLLNVPTGVCKLTYTTGGGRAPRNAEEDPVEKRGLESESGGEEGGSFQCSVFSFQCSGVSHSDNWLLNESRKRMIQGLRTIVNCANVLVYMCY